MTLTDMQFKKANKGEKIIKLSDGGGLQLWIMPIGSKLWHLACRDSQGKQKKLAFGAYAMLALERAGSTPIRRGRFCVVRRELSSSNRRICDCGGALRPIRFVLW